MAWGCWGPKDRPLAAGGAWCKDQDEERASEMGLREVLRIGENSSSLGKNSRAAEALCAACLAAPLSVLGTALSEYPGSAGWWGCT